MLEGISWGTFIHTVAVISAIYYVIVLALYYRGDLNSLGQRKAAVSAREHGKNEESGDPSNIPIDGVQTVLDNIRGVLEQAGKQAGKEGLLNQLHQTLASFDGLRQPAYRNALKNYIIKHAEELCGVGLSGEELESDWADLPR
ncbi:hypothetical protein JHJ32_07430 [Parapedobacter sp. ISTM3]|uniref:hypothetical protein n=1 Tax=Parapedobacter sp. ISTM3 TaxID=2800130 RepID=UPI001904FDEF|nr:hypothetical protein [Parapedobacter sp. ISTM3]MBK1439809.1 hypothetical protein [Parapedobacter sp. ISTM3]